MLSSDNTVHTHHLGGSGTLLDVADTRHPCTRSCHTQVSNTYPLILQCSINCSSGKCASALTVSMSLCWAFVFPKQSLKNIRKSESYGAVKSAISILIWLTT